MRGYAAEVVVAARIMGPRAAGKTLGQEILGRDISPTPIETIVKEVESRQTPMTSEQLRTVVMGDEAGARFLAANPWVIDVTGESAPARKPGRKPRIESSAVADTASPTAVLATKAKQAERAKKATKTNFSQESKSISASAARRQPETSREDEEPNWDLLLLETKKHGNSPAPATRTTQRPPPFISPPFPGVDVSNEQRLEYLAAKKLAIDDYEQSLRGSEWELDPEWNRKGDPVGHVRRVSGREEV
ncbi:MAG: hypothetical protein WCP45_08275 [Verrucomicrobiota bacterium]